MANTQSAGNKKSKKRIIFTRICWAVFFILVLLFLLALPSVIESYAENRLQKLGLINPGLKVRHIGFGKLDVKSLTLGDPAQPDLLIPSAAVDFSLPGILKGKVKKIEIAGMSLQVDLGPQGVNLKGLKQSPRKKTGSTGAVNLPMDELKIHSSVLHLNRGGKKILIPFQISAVKALPTAGSRPSSKKETNMFVFSGSLYPYGETIKVNGRFDFYSGSGTIKISAVNAGLHRYFNDLLDIPAFLFESGAELGSEILLQDWKVIKWRVSAGSEVLDIKFPGGSLTCALHVDFNMGAGFTPGDITLKAKFKRFSDGNVQVEADIPFNLKLEGHRLDDLKFHLTGLQLKDPPGMVFEKFSGTVSGLPGTFLVKGEFTCNGGQQLIPRLLPWLGAGGNLRMTGGFRFALSGENPGLDIKGTGRGSVKLFAPDVEAKLDNLLMDFAYSVKAKGEEIAANVNFTSRGAEIKYDDYRFSAKKLVSRKRVRKKTGADVTINGDLIVTGGKITGSGDLLAQGVDLELPWTIPAPRRLEPGKLSINSFKIAGLDLGRIMCGVSQFSEGFAFSGDIHTPIKNLAANLKGTLKAPDTGLQALVDITVDETDLPADTDLGLLLADLKGYTISGGVKLAAGISLDAGKLKSSAVLKLAEANLNTGPEGVTCSGINTTLKMKDLIAFTSEFSQRLSFASLDIGGVALNGGSLVFRIEDVDTIFIEKGEFSFCDGRVLLNPFRYELAEESGEDFQITLFCDRIDFDKMVNIIMGNEVAEGDAQLNGILPLTISKGSPVFGDGYLYSTPGVKGNLKFKESKVISGGVLLVEEAMKDFQYEWIRVKLDSTAEKLNLEVLIKGEPAKKLPLTYDVKQKDIVRDKQGKRRVHLKGLELKLRFVDIDLKQLLQDGTRIYLLDKKGDGVPRQ